MGRKKIALAKMPSAAAFRENTSRSIVASFHGNRSNALEPKGPKDEIMNNAEALGGTEHQCNGQPGKVSANTPTERPNPINPHARTPF